MSAKDQICEICGRKQEGSLIFAVGAKKDADIAWCMVEGTGRFVCPTCYPTEKERAKKIMATSTINVS